MNEQDVVRIAASRRRFLIGLWPLLVYFVLVNAITVVWSGNRVPQSPPQWLVAVQLALLLAYWWWNRKSALWIEGRPDAIVVRPRRWALVGDLFTGRLRAETPIEEQFPRDASVTFEPSRISWWRVDRALTIEGRRYSVYPEGCRNAVRL